MRYLAIFYFFSLSLFGFNYHLKPYKISEGIHCFFGLPSQVNYLNGGNMINSCYVETNEGYVVIDSGPTYNYAQDAYSIMEKKKKLPVKYVINTSSDEVHILGNEFYKEQGARLIGPISHKELIKNKRPLALEKLLTNDAILNTRIIPLDEYIQSNKSLFLGDSNLQIKTVKNDSEHLYIYIKEKKIIFTGDMVFNNRIVPIKNNRSLLAWIKGLEELAQLDWIDMVSAHGYMTRRSALSRTEDYLKLLRNEVLKHIKNDEFLEDIIEKVKLPAFKEDKLYNIWHHKNISNVYDELLTFSENSKRTNTKIVKVKVSTKIKLKEKKIDKVKPKVLKKMTKKISSIRYFSFTSAIQRAKAKNKIVLIKVRSSSCKYCDQLDRIMKKNSKVKSLINKYFEMVKINVDYEDIPLGIRVRSTPTLIFLQPKNKKILMKLHGIRALGELLDILKEAVDDGHAGSYLRP